MELDRERTARAKAERHAESLQKALDASLLANSTAAEQARRQLDAGRDREEALNVQLAAATAALVLERQRQAELRASSEASATDASTARAQAANLQASVDRLAALVETGARRQSKPGRKRAAKLASLASGT